MAKLLKTETESVIRLHVTAQNKLKGLVLDLARASFSNDRQFDQFVKIVKEYEQSARRCFSDDLVDAGIGESIDPSEIARLK